jgi:hypothetical protein
VTAIVIHRNVQEHFERKPLQSPEGGSVTWWERGTQRFHGRYQIFRATFFFFAAIRFQICFMKLAVLTVRLFNSVAPTLIVLTFVTGA